MMTAITEAVFKSRGQVPKPRIRSWKPIFSKDTLPFGKTVRYVSRHQEEIKRTEGRSFHPDLAFCHWTRLVH